MATHDQQRAHLDRAVDQAEKLSDAELLKGWIDAGAKLLAEKPDEFKQRLAYLLSAFRDKPHFVLEFNLETWGDLGKRLLAGPTRRMVASIALLSGLEPPPN